MVKNLLLIVGSIAMVVMAIVIDARRNQNMQDYAIANNCTWQATGTAYGDDRDFICK